MERLIKPPSSSSQELRSSTEDWDHGHGESAEDVIVDTHSDNQSEIGDHNNNIEEEPLILSKRQSFIQFLPVIGVSIVIAIAIVAIVLFLPRSPIRPIELESIDMHKPIFHLTPARNWMNDPNGPIYHNGYWHIFHQYNPFGVLWGNMNWGHFHSADLVHWEMDDIAISPTDDSPDKDGIFSGCVVVDPESNLPAAVYTGVVSDDVSGHGPPWNQSQNIAFSSDPLLRSWTKYGSNPIIQFPGRPPSNSHFAFRDPFIFKNEKENHLYMLLGSGLENKYGMILLYKSDKLTGPWEYLGEYFNGNSSIYMPPVKYSHNWECPARMVIDGTAIILISSDTPFYKTYYLVGKENLAEMPALDASIVRPLDPGESLYATTIQRVSSCCVNQTKDSRHILWGWLREERASIWFVSAGWAGMLAVPRDISIARNVNEEIWLKMDPIAELLNLRGNQFSQHVDFPLQEPVFLSDFKSRSIDMEISLTLNSGSVSVWVLCSPDAAQRTEIIFEMTVTDVKITGNRQRSSLSEGVYTSDVVTILPLSAITGPIDVRILVDHSVVEIFVNSIVSWSMRVYPNREDSVQVAFDGSGSAVIDAKLWEMKSIWT